MAFGPEAGLALLDEISNEKALAKNHLLPSVRGDLLQKAGRRTEAATEFKRAAGLTENKRERELLLRRAGGMGEPRRTLP
jgi:predicted RNA polymerase sigma factor